MPARSVRFSAPSESYLARRQQGSLTETLMKSSLIVLSIFCAAAAFGAQPHSNSVVVPLTAVSQFLIPAAGSTAGVNGTFFHSDISIVNFASHDQIVKIQWLPQSGAAGSTTTLTIA